MTARRRKVSLMITVATALALTLGTFLLGDIPAGIFELGPGGVIENGVTNIKSDSTVGRDWDEVFGPTGNKLVASDVAAFVIDDISAGSATDTTVFSGGPGDKNQDHISDWTWSTSSVPAKDDITNAYAFTVVVAGKMILLVGLEREDSSGDSHVDIEFFQNPIGLSEEAPCDGGGQCTFTGSNRDGDLLANLDYTQGGTLGGLSIRKRHEGVKNNYDLAADLQGEGCNPAGPGLPANTVCAFTNGAPIDGGPWPNYDNHGAVITTLPTNAFTEFALNVTDLFGGATPCFSTIMVKTRSSQSFTATLKDFSLHSFQQCTAAARTEIHAGPKVGATHTAADLQGTAVSVQTQIHDRVVVEGTAGFAAPTGNVVFKRFLTIDCTGSFTSETVALETLSGTSNAAAESASFTPGPGPLSYLAEYQGDTNYGAVNAPCEPLTVSKFNSAVNTDIKLNNQSGASVLNTALDITTAKNVVDVATITGNGGQAGSLDPTGTVTFRRYTTGDCSGSYTDEVINISADAAPNNLDGLKTAVSAVHTLNPSSGVFLSFAVIYSGDSNYNPSVALKCEAICAFPFDKAIQ